MSSLKRDSVLKQMMATLSHLSGSVALTTRNLSSLSSGNDPRTVSWSVLTDWIGCCLGRESSAEALRLYYTMVRNTCAQE